MEQIRVCTFDGPGAQQVIRTVSWPDIPKKAALIKVGACGVCGTDLHILKGHWPKQLPWPFTLGHEIGGVLVEVGSEFREDFSIRELMDWPLRVGRVRWAARRRHQQERQRPFAAAQLANQFERQPRTHAMTHDGKR